MGKRGVLPKNKLPVAAEVSTAPDKERERRWRAESALDTLTLAEEHKKDKQLMSDVKQLAREKKNQLEKVCK